MKRQSNGEEEGPEPDPVRDRLVLEGDINKFLKFHNEKLRQQLVRCRKMQEEVESLKRKVEDLEQKEKCGLCKCRGGPEKLPKKKVRQGVTREVLGRYFSKAQINYLLEYKGGNDENPRVRWSSQDVNKFARLKTRIKICGYNYIRRMNIVPMPSLNIIRRAQKQGTLSRETLDIMDRKITSKTASNCAPKTGISKGAKNNATKAMDNKWMLDEMMEALQSNNLPSIVVRRWPSSPSDSSPRANPSEEVALFTPTPGTRTGIWNDEEFNTVLHKRTVTGYSRRKVAIRSEAAAAATMKKKVDVQVPKSEDGAKNVVLSGRDSNCENRMDTAFTIVESSAPGAGLSVHAVPISCQNKVIQLDSLNQLVIANPVQQQQPDLSAATITVLTQPAPTFVSSIETDPFQHHRAGTTVVYENGQIPAASQVLQGYQAVSYAAQDTRQGHEDTVHFISLPEGST